jgi:hypothetical protein
MGAVAMQQQEELAAQKEEQPGQSAVGDQQDLVEVVDADDPEDKESHRGSASRATQDPRD